jgi:signal transduction histidine kinase
MRKVRLFWLMVIAFFMSIGVAVCGMIGFLGLTFAGTVPSQPLRDGLHEAAVAYAAILSDYYVANGSWEGVDQRLNAPPFAGPSTFYSYTIVDDEGQILASSLGMPEAPVAPRAPQAPEPRLHRGVPIERAALRAHGREVGILLVQPEFSPTFSASSSQRTSDRAPSFLWNLWRNMLLAGLTLGGLLLALAIIFARRLTNPLGSLTAASEALAAGRLDTRVPPAAVRELDELAGAFNRMAERLSAADVQRRLLTADVAHELRTPLAIIRGRLEGIQDGIYEPEPEQIAGLLHETALLERLVDDLRLLALAEAGQLPLYREPTDPRDLLEGAAAAFADQAARQSVALQIDAAKDLPAIDADPQRIAQVLANLVSNALRYTPARGSILLSARLAHEPARTRAPDKGRPALALPGQHPPDRALLAAQAGLSAWVTIDVCDSGQGIAPEDLPRVFDRFWRADRSRARGSGGAGLGLAIVKQIVEAHGGSVAAWSAAGQGTRFSIRLPAAAGRRTG